MSIKKRKPGHPTSFQIVKRLSKYALPYWKHLVAAFAMVVATGAMQILRPWPLAFALNTAINAEAGAGVATVVVLEIAGMLVMIGLLDGLSSYLLTYFVNRAGRQIVSNVRTASFEQVQKMPLSGQKKKQSGDMLVRLTGDVKALNKAFTESLVEIVYAVIFMVSMAGVLLWMDWQLGLVALAAVPILLFALQRNTAALGESSQAERKSEGSLAAIFIESLQSAGVIRLFNQEAEVTEKFRKQSDAAIERGVATKLSQERIAWIVNVTGAISVAAVLGVGLYRVSSGAVSPGGLVVFVTYVRNFYSPLRSAAKGMGLIARTMPSAERVLELLEADEGEADAPDAKKARFTSGSVEFRQVQFSYEKRRPILVNINVEVPDGEFTAIVGPTGSGKTSLVSLIPRLYDPDQGEVLVAGEDIRKFTKESLRTLIGMVPQEPSLIHDSITANIAFGDKDASFGEIEEAAWLAGAHDFIRRMPGGYSAKLGERGDTLSGGQRRLIAIARALVRNAPILILDEPLAGLDADSAALVMDSLDAVRAERTMIVVTHDLALSARADCVIVMADGQVVEQGSHQALLASGGLYRRLVDAQRGEGSELILAGRPSAVVVHNPIDRFEVEESDLSEEESIVGAGT